MHRFLITLTNQERLLIRRRTSQAIQTLHTQHHQATQPSLGLHTSKRAHTLRITFSKGISSAPPIQTSNMFAMQYHNVALDDMELYLEPDSYVTVVCPSAPVKASLRLVGHEASIRRAITHMRTHKQTMNTWYALPLIVTSFARTGTIWQTGPWKRVLLQQGE